MPLEDSNSKFQDVPIHSLKKDLMILERHRARNNIKQKIRTKKMGLLFSQLSQLLYNDERHSTKMVILTDAISYINYLKDQINW